MSSSASSPQSDDVVKAVNVMFVVRPEQRTVFLKEIRADQIGTYQDEPGALQFVLGQDAGKSNTFHLHEQYRSSADLDFHEQTPHFAKFQKYCESQQPFQQNIVINKYYLSTVSSSSEGGGGGGDSTLPLAVRQPIVGAYCLNVESCIKPEIRDEFVALMETHAVASRAEPACLQFDWGICENDTNTFYVHEEYKDKPGYLAHEETAHFARFMAFNQAKDPYRKPQVVSFYEII